MLLLLGCFFLLNTLQGTNISHQWERISMDFLIFPDCQTGWDNVIVPRMASWKYLCFFSESLLWMFFGWKCMKLFLDARKSSGLINTWSWNIVNWQEKSSTSHHVFLKTCRNFAITKGFTSHHKQTAQFCWEKFEKMSTAETTHKSHSLLGWKMIAPCIHYTLPETNIAPENGWLEC